MVRGKYIVNSMQEGLTVHQVHAGQGLVVEKKMSFFPILAELYIDHIDGKKVLHVVP
jgi:hypothetical protein